MRVPTIVSLISLTPAAILTAQAERFTIAGEEIAIYNLAGNVTIEPGTGAPTVHVTRGGAGAGKLTIAQGEIGGRSTLRVVYPADRIVYPAHGQGLLHRFEGPSRRHVRRRRYQPLA